MLGPVVGPIEGIPGTGGPLGPKPKPPITIPAPPQEQGGGKGGKGDGGKKDDEEKDGKSKSAGPVIPQPERNQKKGTVLF